jgi:asparagine synthase (glutamine-hydrolysing)
VAGSDRVAVRRFWDWRSQVVDPGSDDLAADLGIHMAHPFLDPRVVCLALGAQLRLRAAPGARKPILVEATRGLLPEPIRTRRVKGHFGEACYLGLARNLPRLEALVEAAADEALAIVDRPALLDCLHRAALGVPTRFGVEALGRLNLTLALFTWLSRREEWLREAPPVEPIRLDPAIARRAPEP